MSSNIYKNHVKFAYTNYKGETALRDVHPISLVWMQGKEGASHGADYTGWCLTCWDHDRQATRTFALDKITVPEGVDSYRLLMLHPGNVTQGDFTND